MSNIFLTNKLISQEDFNLSSSQTTTNSQKFEFIDDETDEQELFEAIRQKQLSQSYFDASQRLGTQVDDIKEEGSVIESDISNLNTKTKEKLNFEEGNFVEEEEEGELEIKDLPEHACRFAPFLIVYIFFFVIYFVLLDTVVIPI